MRYKEHPSTIIKTNRIITLFISLTIVVTAFGQDVTYNRAKEIASGFFKDHGIASEMVVPQKARMKDSSKVGANSPYYIFNSEDASAFVVISGDSRTPEVFAYSTEGAFDEENIAPGVEYMLEQYELYVNSLQTGENAPAARAIVDFGNGRLIETALWDQSPSPWWNYCPTYRGKNTYAGCVATAMAILMRHYEWPLRGFGNKTYTTESLGLNLSANFEEFNYNWSSLPKGNMNASGWNTSNKTTVGKLLYQCGVAANMDYNTSESSTISISQAIGLFRYFGYSMGNYVAKDNVTEEDWYNYIIDEINGNNPVFYRGENDYGDHAFICDGYDANGNLHFNFGWSGSGNGYYAIMESNMTFRNKQGMFIDVRPDFNAASRTLPDFQMKKGFNSEPDGLTIPNNGIIHPGQSFTAKASNLLNVSETDVNFSLAVYICDEKGNRIVKLGETTDLNLKSEYFYNWVTVRCSMPYDYTVSDTDYLMIFSSIDNGATWKEVTCYDPELGRIRLETVYDATPSHMEMIYVEDREFGLTVRDGSLVNVKGQGFYITANCLKNNLVQSFIGDVAAFLCDNNGNKKFMIGSTTIEELKSQYYYYTWDIGCTIPKGADVAVGDKIMIFTRLPGDETWANVNCADPDRAYIEITTETLTATPTQLQMIEVADRNIGLTLYNDNKITIGNGYFYLTCNCLKNILPNTFKGEVAVFLCDKNGKPIYKLGSYTFSELKSYYYRYNFSIKCTITSEMDVLPGDRMCVFSRYYDDDVWSYIDCVVPEKAYIELPTQLIPAQKSISFSSICTMFSSRYDLDFSAVEDVHVYKAVREKDTDVVLERVTKVNSGEGVLLRGINKSSNGEYCVYPVIVEDVATGTENMFVGVIGQSINMVQDSQECIKYVLSSNGETFRIANGETISSGQAYLEVPCRSGSTPDILRIVFSESGSTNPLGDVNGDGDLSIADVVGICNLILEVVTDEAVLATADIDRNGQLTVADLVLLVNIVLSAE